MSKEFVMKKEFAQSYEVVGKEIKCNYSPLRIVFMGTPEFASYILESLINNGANIVGVITVPDKPAGRGQKLSQSSVKQTALKYNLPVLQPLKLKDPVFIDELKSLKPDLQIVVAFRMLPEIVWNLPPKGSFNLHTSLLPQYRGAAPINWAIINGEKETGVTTFFLDNNIDTGNTIFSQKINIDNNETAGTLHDKLMATGADVVLKTVKAIAESTVTQTPQPKIPIEELKSAPKIFKEDCRIDWNLPAEIIINKIRGLSPYPASYTEIISSSETITALKLFSARNTEASELDCGETFSDGKKILRVGTGTTDIELIDIQLAGKKRMNIEDFLRGFRWEEMVKMREIQKIENF